MGLGKAGLGKFGDRRTASLESRRKVVAVAAAAVFGQAEAGRRKMAVHTMVAVAVAEQAGRKKREWIERNSCSG